jgi:integrase
MNTNSIRILYVIDRAKLNKQDKCPIRCRITYLGNRRPFSTGLFVNPNQWNSKKQKAFPPSENNNHINSQLSLISQKINKAFLMLQVNEVSFDVGDIYLAYKGENTKKNKSFLEIIQLHNSRMGKLVGKEYAPKYYQKWKGTHKLLQAFIRYSYKKNDVLLSKITLKFLDDLDFYLKSNKNQKQITVNKCIQRVRRVVKLAIAEGYLETDPFILYKPKRYVKEIVYLDVAELQKLEKVSLAQERLIQVRDMFIFCCYTGLAYQEMNDLKNKHIVKGFDGNTWIKMVRRKTKTPISVPLLPKAEEILHKYNNLDIILPVISNQKFNSYIKEIAVLAGIDKKITHHIARKTFATTILLYNDVPMEIVSDLLGHSKLDVTQRHYAKVVQRKVGEHMTLLGKKLGKN